MKLILFVILLFSEVECTSSTTVYLCSSPNAKKYHLKENCRGLSGCQYQIVKATLANAQKENKTLCGWEQKK